MKTKILFVLLTLTLVISACGGTAANQPAANAAPVEVKVMMWGAPEELAVWQTIADDFSKINPGIKVTMDVSDWTTYWDKLNTLYAASTPPDAFAMDAPLFMDWYSRDALKDLQPYIDATPGMLDGLYPITLKAYDVNGHYYGLPRDFQTVVLYYNKDMFDAAKLPYPDETWTFDKLRTVARQLTITDASGKVTQWGFATDLWDMELFWSEAIWGYGGQILSDNYSQTLLTEGKALDAWNFIADMVLKDKSIPNADEAGQYGGDPFDAGVAAMTTIGHWTVPTYITRSFKWDVAPIPAGPAGRATSVNSAGFVIAKNAVHADEAWQFIKYVLSEPGQRKLASLGLSVPVLKSVAESDAYLKQATAPINQKVFVDALQYAHMKPVFRGYDQWSTVVGDGLIPVWTGEKDLATALAEIKPQADAVLAQYYK